MFTINNKNVLPEIFAMAHRFSEEVSALLANVAPEQVNQKAPAYLTNGFPYAKAALGDLCVGVKALGDKLGVLGGNSFVLLKEQSDAIVSATGNFFNKVARYNAENGYAELMQIAKDYLTLLSNTLKELSTATTHLYGDAKCRLGDQFESMENAMVSFFRMAKVKIVAALVDLQIVTAYALQYFDVSNIANANLLNQDGSLNKPACQQIVLSLNPDFDDAKNLALKMFN